MQLDATKNNQSILSSHEIDRGVSVLRSKIILSEILNAETRIIIFVGSHLEFITIFQTAKTMGMTSEKYAWLCSDAVSQSFISSSNYTGVINFFPTEKYESNMTDTFVNTYRELRRNYNRSEYNFPRGEDINTGNVLENPLFNPIRPFVYFAATCVDNVVYGLDKFMKDNATRTIDKLIAGDTV